jgi:hypothetical protein
MVKHQNTRHGNSLVYDLWGGDEYHLHFEVIGCTPAARVDMRRNFLFTLLAFSALLITLGGCCAPTLLHPILSGPQQAQHENEAAVALVADFLPNQSPFCTGVWVSKDTILTANHCVVGYVEMQHRYMVMKALMGMGLPEEMAAILSQADVSTIPDEDKETIMAQMLIQANNLFPKLDPMEMTLQYAVPHDITNVGERPNFTHNAGVVAMYANLDLALLHVYGDMPAHRIAILADQVPPVGAEVSLVGNTEGNWFSFKHTVISAYRHSMITAGFHTQGSLIQVMDGINHGDSGGGLFNDQGQLIGIIDAMNPDTEFGLCIHLDNIRAVLIGQHVILGHLDTQAVDPDLDDASLNLENP